MMRVFRYAAIFLAVVVVLVTGLYITLRILYPPEKLRALISSELDRRLGKPVSFGDVGFSILRGFALDVEDFVIKESGGSGNGFLVSVEHFILKVKLRPLLSRRIEIDRIAFVRPEVYYTIMKNGTTNFDGLIPADTAKADSPARGTDNRGEETFPFALTVSGASISDGILHYRNEASLIDVTIAPIGMDLSFGFDREMTAAGILGTLSIGGADVRKPENLKILADRLTLAMTYNASADLHTGKVEFKELNLETPGISWKCTGSIPDFRADPFRFALSWDAKAEKVGEILNMAPPGYEDFMKILKFDGDLSITGSASGNSDFEPAPEINAGITVRNGGGRITAFPREIRDMNATVTLTNKKIEITAFEMKIGDDPFQLVASAEITGDMPFSADIKTSLNINDLPRILPDFSAWKTKGTLDIDMKVKGTAGDLMKSALHGKAAGRDMVIESPDYPKPILMKSMLAVFDGPKVRLTGGLEAGESSLSFEGAALNFMSILSDSPIQEVPVLTWNALVKAPLFREADFVIPDDPGAKANGVQSAGGEIPMILPRSKGEAVITIGRFVSADGLELENLVMNAVVAGNVISVTRMTGDMYGGSLTGTGKLTVPESGKPLYDFSMSMEGVNVGPALTPFTRFGGFISGTMSSSMEAAGTGIDYGEIMKTLRSTGRLNIQEGKIAGMPLLAHLARWSKISSWETIPFTNWHGAFSVENERLSSKDLVLSTPFGEWTVSGSVGFDYSMDLKAQVALNRDFVEKYRSVLPGNILGFLSDEKGSVVLGLNISGQESQPKFAWDTSILRQNVEQAMTKKVGEQLKKLIGKASGGSSDSAAGRGGQSASQSIEKEARDELNRLAGKILGQSPDSSAKKDTASAVPRDSAGAKDASQKVIDQLKKLFK